MYYCEQDFKQFVTDNIKELTRDYSDEIEPECRQDDQIIEEWMENDRFWDQDFEEYCKESFDNAIEGERAKQESL